MPVAEDLVAPTRERILNPVLDGWGRGARAHEHRLLAAIHVRFGLPAKTGEALEAFIKKADRMAAYLEATQLAGFSIPEADKFFGRPRGLDGEGSQKFHRLKPLAPTEAAAIYLKTFHQLL